MRISDWSSDVCSSDLQAERNTGTVMPGFTHLQTAQPVTFGHHLMAYAEMLLRDRGRLAAARKRLNESPLGAAALAGTSFPIDRHDRSEERRVGKTCVSTCRSR